MPNLRLGHARNDVRDEFVLMLEMQEFSNLRMSELTGALWNCTDILPSMYRSLVPLSDKSPAHTYAQAARRVRRVI